MAHTSHPGHAAETLDREHQVQIGLIEALCSSVEQGDGRAGEILDQLIAYSSAHFMSEELLMRLSGYDEYDDHVADHIHMMDTLNAMTAQQRLGKSALLLVQALEILKFITRHIETRDRRFVESGLGHLA